MQSVCFQLCTSAWNRGDTQLSHASVAAGLIAPSFWGHSANEDNERTARDEERPLTAS